MKLFDQIIRKELELSEESYITKHYKRAVWRFFVAYNISRAVLGYDDPLIKKKNRLCKKFILSNEYIDSKLFMKLQKIMQKDMEIIIKALKEIERKKEEAGYEFGEYYKPLSLGILAYEYPEEAY